MRKTLTHLLLLAVLFGTSALFAQSKFSGSMYTGILRGYNDFKDADYTGYMPNLGVGGAIGYNFSPSLRLRANLMAGLLNGNNAVSYYRTQMFEGALQGHYNVLSLIQPDNKIKIDVLFGGGIMYYNTERYDINTRQKLVESPVPTVKSLSPNGFLRTGAELGLPVTTNLDFNLSYQHNYLLFGNDWVDGQMSGEHNDHYGMFTLGFTYYLKSTRKPGTVEVDETRYNELLGRVDSLENYEPEPVVDNSKIAALEMENKEQELEIQTLKARLDSASAAGRTATFKTDNTRPVQYNPAVQASLGAPKYRIVVASLPSQVQAERWIQRSNLDKSEMVVAYIEDLNTFRVVYKSYDTVEAARKDLPGARSLVPDAWIVRF